MTSYNGYPAALVEEAYNEVKNGVISIDEVTFDDFKAFREFEQANRTIAEDVAAYITSTSSEQPREFVLEDVDMDTWESIFLFEGGKKKKGGNKKPASPTAPEGGYKDTEHPGEKHTVHLTANFHKTHAQLGHNVNDHGYYNHPDRKKEHKKEKDEHAAVHDTIHHLMTHGFKGLKHKNTGDEKDTNSHKVARDKEMKHVHLIHKDSRHAGSNHVLVTTKHPTKPGHIVVHSISTHANNPPTRESAAKNNERRGLHTMQKTRSTITKKDE